MTYRIACIYVEEQASLKEVRLEVCNEGASSQIAPFVRKATVTDLANDDNLLTREFAALLTNLGFERQPFKLNGKEIENPEIIRLLKHNRYNFIQCGNNCSLKKGSSSLFANSSQLPTAKLLGGSLYMTIVKAERSTQKGGGCVSSCRKLGAVRPADFYPQRRPRKHIWPKKTGIVRSPEACPSPAKAPLRLSCFRGRVSASFFPEKSMTDLLFRRKAVLFMV